MKSRKNRSFSFESVTLDNITSVREFYHKTLRNADGSPLRVRVNGMLKLWKTRPNDFKLPVKYGLYDCTYITHENSHEWAVKYTESV